MDELILPEPRNPIALLDPVALFAEFIKMDVADGYAMPETVKTYFSQVREFMTWCKGQEIDPATITEMAVKEYREYLVDQKFALSTISNKLMVLRRFYDMIETRGFRPDNPARGVKAPKDRTNQSERIKWLPTVAIHLLLNVPDIETVKGKRDRAMIALMLLHGLRVMEVAGVQLKDLDLERKMLIINGKGGKIRSTYLVDMTEKLIKTWLDIRPTVAKTDHIFVNMHHDPDIRGKGMNKRGIRKVIDLYLTELALKKPRISCHALRHTFATQSLAAGAKLIAISDALGHSSVVTTQIYAKLIDKIKDNPTQLLVGMLERE